MARKKKKTKAPGRKDARYRNPDEAPEIVSEKRLTFFLPLDLFRRAKLLAGHNMIRNADGEVDDDGDPHPDSPSAIARAAIAAYLDANE